MKYKISLTCPLDQHEVEFFQRKTHDLLVTPNGEQVLAMAKLGEVDRVCIVFGAYTYYEFDIMEALHKIDPSIPIRVLTSDKTDKISKNEYITNNVGLFFECVNEFFNGDFNEKDCKLFPKFVR